MNGIQPEHSVASIHRAKITSNGRVTIPVEIRESLGIRPGDVVVFEVLDGRLAFRRSEPGEDQTSESLPDDEVDPTAGIFAKYAYTRNPDPAEERRWVARHIAETADMDN